MRKKTVRRIQNSAADANFLIRRMSLEKGLILKKTREKIEKLGRPAVKPLGKALKYSKHWEVRWEAAKALGTLADPAATSVLVDALEDVNTDVGWVAAESLISLGEAAVRPLLKALEKRPGCPGLRMGARHVLRHRRRANQSDIYAGVLAALETGATQEGAATAIYQVLKPK
jgi:HEAT repeat protein